jgi:general secretion pathway protein J
MFTRQGWRNPLGLRRSSLQRVAWEYTGNELHRHYWLVVDQGRGESPRAVLLLENVQAFDVWLLDKDGNRAEQWPPEDVLAELAAGERPTAALPRGVEVSLEHEQFGEIFRIFTLPDFDQAAAQELINRKQQSEAGTDAE